MAAKKDDMQKEFSKMLDQAKEGLQKFGKEVSVLAKKSEKEIVKASKIGKIQVDMMGLGMQKEKLYYDIGKNIASLKNKKSLDIPELDSFWKKLRAIESDTRKKKRELSQVRKPKKKK